MDVTFESFAELVFHLDHPPPSELPAGINGQRPPLSPARIFRSWISHLPSPLPAKTTAHVFRLLFPHEGNRRRYGLRETQLAAELESVLAVEGLTHWDAAPETTRSNISIAEVDALLDELAAHSDFSQLSQTPIALRPPSTILRCLYRDAGLSPRAMAVLTQVILRDLRPLLYPLALIHARHPTLLLGVPASAGPTQLGLHEAMWAWEPAMARLFRDGKGCMEWCAAASETVKDDYVVSAGPVLNVNVQIPKCVKGRSVRDALKGFIGKDCRSVWAETKYDGYRLILAALGLTIGSAHPMPRPRISARRTEVTSVILEAEVVPYNEGDREGGRGPGIEEFWRLQAAGVSSAMNPSLPLRLRHLCLVFFDILHLNGKSLIDSAYLERRRLLERVVHHIEGFSLLATRAEIPLHLGTAHAEEVLGKVFQQSCQRREGLVLKADESVYVDTQLRWVKLKKDYIPNVGDCVDLVLLGAGWDIDRAHELRVDTSVYTTFYVGTLTNREGVTKHRQVPHFEFLFAVSYGMTRDQLELYNANIRLRRWATKPFDRDDKWKRSQLMTAVRAALAAIAKNISKIRAVMGRGT
ncbi:hypothetical protein CspeluHIS016_0102730 [Cutaneotrichosporon spelunceum]|uniref:ATP-dependent DNA ligase family profile domain-containing protein n=1 Tax=Cutaneotrichosporon spelunceum TaxID=1672016 RepID=A0AAD3TN89_9TREE|nr:hypothetical protein CspeluHIS016_0102730 [Cutaneotrichosporon spelunceum]